MQDGPQRLGHFAFCPYRWSNSLSLELNKELSVVFTVLRISLLSLWTEKHASQLCLESVLWTAIQTLCAHVHNMILWLLSFSPSK